MKGMGRGVGWIARDLPASKQPRESCKHIKHHALLHFVCVRVLATCALAV